MHVSIKSYRELEVWQLAMSLAEDVYGTLKALPNDERFALTSQLRRAVVSIPSNIAEGFGRDTTRDFLHFVAMARGSLYEVMTQMELAVRLAYVPEQTGFREKAERVGMMLNALSTRLHMRLDATNIKRHSPTNHESRITDNENGN